MSSSEMGSPPNVHLPPGDFSSSVSLSPPRIPHDTERVAPPRLSSPHHFRNIFGTQRSDGSQLRLSELELPPIDYYRETMNDVNRALQSANRALQSAQEAFRSRSSVSFGDQNRRQDVVDLTGTSPPIAAGPAPAAEDGVLNHYLSRMADPFDFSTRQQQYEDFMNDSMYTMPFADEDPSAAYTGPDSQAGPRRRYHTQRLLGDVNMTLPSDRAGPPLIVRSDEEAAVRRQRVARAQWERNRQRANERQRLEEQRRRLLHSSGTSRGSQTVQSSTNAITSSPTRPPPSLVSSGSSIEAVDLTQVDDDPTLAAVLSQQRQDAISSQNKSSTDDGGAANTSNSGISSGGRTPLTAYKCPICMEPPQSATTTSCGHLFCHKCIIDTLKWSEQQRRDDAPPSRRVRGVCPVCRKELMRREEPGRQRTLIPLELKLMTKRELKRKREEEEELLRRKKREESKGKGKMQDVSDIDDLSGPQQLNEVDALPVIKHDPTDSLFDFGSDEDFV